MKPPSPELLELCGAVRDDAATPEQVARLEALLADDPESRRFYRRFIQITASLERYEQSHTHRRVAAPLSPGARHRWRSRRISWFALAAGLLVIASVSYFLGPAIEVDPSATEFPHAYMQEAHACTVIPRDGSPAEFAGRTQIRPGDIVTTAANGSAIIRFENENTLFILSADTRAGLSQDEGSKTIHLTSGQIYCDVARQGVGNQWRIITSDGEAKVLGTRLAVSAGHEGTRIAVTSGRVRVTARDSRQTIEAPAGFAAELTPTTAILVRLAPTEPTRLASFTLVAADTNTPLPGYDVLPDGAVLDLAQLPTRRINIRANCEPQLVGAVRFSLAGVDPYGAPLTLVVPEAHSFPNQIEIYFPYMLAGDPSIIGEQLPQHSFAWTPPVGRYTLTATPFATMKGSGARGEPLTIQFEVVDGAAVR